MFNSLELIREIVVRKVKYRWKGIGIIVAVVVDEVRLTISH
jgi:hypothetical protein